MIYTVDELAPPLQQPLLVCLDGKEWEIATAWQYSKPQIKRVWLIKHTMREIQIEDFHTWKRLPPL